jgi:hypothetical protein
MSNSTALDKLQNMDWEKMRKDVNLRIDYLQAVVEQLDATLVNEKIANDLIMPTISMLGRFCSSVKVEEDTEKSQPNAEVIVPFRLPTV